MSELTARVLEQPWQGSTTGWHWPPLKLHPFAVINAQGTPFFIVTHNIGFPSRGNFGGDGLSPQAKQSHSISSILESVKKIVRNSSGVLLIRVAKTFVRLHVARFRHSGGSRNPGRTGSRLYLGQCMDPGFRRGDEWQHAISFGKHCSKHVQRWKLHPNS